MIDPDGYRPNVGIVLMRGDGRVFWARRVNRDGWQFPQGGMNTDETPVEAMYRELREETGLQPDHVELLISGGLLSCGTKLAGQYRYFGEQPYEPDLHRWLRIRERDGNTLWEVSADGCEWTLLASRAKTEFSSMSERVSASSPRACSGDRYASVPMTIPGVAALIVFLCALAAAYPIHGVAGVGEPQLDAAGHHHVIFDQQ